MAESFVQVAPDSTGKSIRNVSIQAVQSDGSIVTVQMQAVNIFDEFGNQVKWVAEDDWRVQMLDEMRAVRIAMQTMWDAGTLPKERDNFLDLAQAERDPNFED